jgi:hypothetical protein
MHTGRINFPDDVRRYDRAGGPTNGTGSTVVRTTFGIESLARADPGGYIVHHMFQPGPDVGKLLVELEAISRPSVNQCDAVNLAFLGHHETGEIVAILLVCIREQSLAYHVRPSIGCPKTLLRRQVPPLPCSPPLVPKVAPALAPTHGWWRHYSSSQSIRIPAKQDHPRAPVSNYSVPRFPPSLLRQ